MFASHWALGGRLAEQVVREMGLFGLDWTDTLDFVPWQHMMIVTKVE